MGPQPIETTLAERARHESRLDGPTADRDDTRGTRAARESSRWAHIDPNQPPLPFSRPAAAALRPPPRDRQRLDSRPDLDQRIRGNELRQRHVLEAHAALRDELAVLPRDVALPELARP